MTLHADPPKRSPAFTFRDLLACLAVGLLGIALAIPALANNKGRSDRAVCISNLASIGRAFNQWASEHGGMYPVYVDVRDGGTRNHPSGLNNNLWFQMAWLSNELVTPRILACPADRKVRVAQEFTSLNPNSGFLHPNFQNTAVSYFLGWPKPSDGRLLLSGDNGLPSTISSASEVQISPVFVINAKDPNLRWVPGTAHRDAGNLLFNDGSVEQADNLRLREVMRSYTDDPLYGTKATFQFPRWAGP